jgi:hypothetical protein
MGHADLSQASRPFAQTPSRQVGHGAGWWDSAGSCRAARSDPAPVARRQARLRGGPNVRLTSKAVREIGQRYEDQGLNRALYDLPRPGAAPLLTPAQRKQIVAMVCSDPPEGFARWTVRLIAEEAVKRKLVPRVGRETIRILLQHDDLQPWRKKNVVRRRTRWRVYQEDGGRAESL